MDSTDQIHVLKAAQGDPAKLALATVNLAYPTLPDAEVAVLRDSLEAAAIPHWCDEAILSALQETSLEESASRLDRLRRLNLVEPFPSRGEQAVNVHESARLALRAAMAGQPGGRFQALSARAVSFMQNDRTRVGCIERLYHLLCAEPEQGARVLAKQDREWSRSANSEECHALVAALGELEAARLVHGRTRVWVLLAIAWSRRRCGEASLLVDLAKEILDLAVGTADVRAEGDAYALLAEALRAGGKLSEARAADEEARAIRRRVAEQRPRNEDQPSGARETRDKLGRVPETQAHVRTSYPTRDILCLMHRAPYPPNGGDRIRSYHMLRYLGSRARVHLAFPTTEPVPVDTMRILQSLCYRVAAAPISKHLRWLQASWSLAKGGTATEGLFRSRTLEEGLRSWGRETRFDAAFVASHSMVQYLDLKELEMVPAVVDFITASSQEWFDYAWLARGLKRYLFNLEGSRLRKLEASVVERVAAAIVGTECEADLFHSFSPYLPHVIRNGVDLDYFRPGEDISHAAPSCVFAGTLDHAANLDGIRWFCHNIWHEILAQYPQAVFRLVGGRVSSSVQRLAMLPGVELVGPVPDVRPYLRSATVVTVPLRMARGLPNKVLEGLAMGKPVVASPQVLSGINGLPNTGVVCAAAPTDWTRAICELFEDPNLCNSLGDSGRAFVEKEYVWAKQLAKLNELPGLGPCLKAPPVGTRGLVVPYGC
jgi:sugar transferase (PEP-CTERM/EpsH1 system associated)